MSHESQIYRIDLEDYSYPRYASILRPYFGTQKDIRELMIMLRANSWTRKRYSDTIDAFDRYSLEPDVVHTMAGQETPILIPVEQVLHTTFTMHDPSWVHQGHSGAYYPARVLQVNVEQMLVAQENVLYRCARVQFQELKFCLPNFSWTFFNHDIRGFPGQLRFDDAKTHSMTLYAGLNSYAPQDMTRAIQDCNTLSNEDLSTLCIDILGEV